MFVNQDQYIERTVSFILGIRCVYTCCERLLLKDNLGIRCKLLRSLSENNNGLFLHFEIHYLKFVS